MDAEILLERLCLEHNVGLRVSYGVVDGKNECEVRITNADFDMREKVVGGTAESVRQECIYRMFRTLFVILICVKNGNKEQIFQLVN